MGLLNLFRKKKEIQELETVQFEAIGEFISHNKKSLKEREVTLVQEIRNRLTLLVGELEEKINVLESVDLSQRKVEDRIKQISKTNLDRYLILLNELKNELNSLSFSTLQESSKIISKIQKFERDSYLNFEKATILVGKEMESVVQSIKSFLTDYKTIINSNKDLMENFSAIAKIEERAYEISEIEKNLKWYGDEKKRASENLSSINEKVKGLVRMEEEILESPDHKVYLEEKSSLEKRKEGVKQGINHIKSLINLKRIASVHHSNEKKMAIIAEYKADFFNAFERDKGESILDLLDDNQAVQEEISKIRYMLEEVSSFSLGEDKVKHIQEEISKTRNFLSNQEEEIKKIDKRISQNISKIYSLKENLSSELKKINVELK
ncbi:MAG: hypothetical protein Q8Q31_00730 [Nanoarchaeota archaeon]|nr:hypothetical protein [Nanoarchaeota archaeon]